MSNKREGKRPMFGRLVFLALAIRLLFVFGQYHPDLGNHLDWGNRLWQHGPQNFYTGSVWTVSWPNQPPGTIYLWGLISKINQGIFSLFWLINLKVSAFPSIIIPFLEKNLHPALAKLPSVLAELGIGWLIYKILLMVGVKEKKALFGAGLFLFNPVTIYNSSVWGQTDGIVNFLALGSVFLIFKKKYFWAALAFLFSIYIKLSLVIFLPLILLLFWRQKTPVLKTVLSFAAAFFCLILVSWPFMHGNPFIWLRDLYLNRVLGGQGNMLTANAFNLWAVIFGIDLSRSDVGLFLGLSHKVWGMLLFALAYLAVLFQVLKNKFSQESLFFSFALVSLASFMFLSNMHERYLYPAFPYLALLAALGRAPLGFYLLISFIHLLNLYHLWYFPRVDLLVEIFKWPGSVRVLSLTLLIASFWLYLFFAKINLKSLKN